MKKITLIFASIFGFIMCAKSQSVDTVSAKVLWIKDLKRIYLIGIKPDLKSADTIIVVSEVKKRIGKKWKEIKIGGTYIWTIETEIEPSWETKTFSVSYQDIVVWTRKDRFKRQPRLCSNCRGTYISPL